MPRKKKPTVEGVRSLRQQLEYHIFNLVVEFEDLSGVKVRRVDISRERKIGFERKETVTIDIDLDL